MQLQPFQGPTSFSAESLLPHCGKSITLPLLCPISSFTHFFFFFKAFAEQLLCPPTPEVWRWMKSTHNHTLLCPPGAFSLSQDDLANKRIKIEAFTRHRCLSYLRQLLLGFLYFHMFTQRWLSLIVLAVSNKQLQVNWPSCFQNLRRLKLQIFLSMYPREIGLWTPCFRK